MTDERLREDFLKILLQESTKDITGPFKCLPPIHKLTAMVKAAELLTCPSIVELIENSEGYSRYRCLHNNEVHNAMKFMEERDAANSKLEALTEDYGDALVKVERLEKALRSASKAMNYLGDILNNMDAATKEDEEFTAPLFKEIREVLNPESKEPEKVCPECGGSGYKGKPFNGYAFLEMTEQCLTCHGTGNIKEEK